MIALARRLPWRVLLVLNCIEGLFHGPEMFSIRMDYARKVWDQ